MLCENGNAQILCAQNERFMDALSCAPDEVCRNGQGCAKANDGPAIWTWARLTPKWTRQPHEDMNTSIENDMTVPVELDMSVPMQDAAPPPVDAAPPPMCQEYPLDRLPGGCDIDSERFVSLMERALRNMEQATQVCPALANAQEPGETVEYFMRAGGDLADMAWAGDPQFEHLYGREICVNTPNTDRFLFHFYPYISQIDDWSIRCFAEFNPRILLGDNNENVADLCLRWSDSTWPAENPLLRCEQCDAQTGPALGDGQALLNGRDAELARIMSLVDGKRRSCRESRSCRAFVFNSDRTGDFAEGYAVPNHETIHGWNVEPARPVRILPPSNPSCTRHSVGAGFLHLDCPPD